MKFTVSDVAGILGLSNETIRYYIREGLIHPEKTARMTTMNIPPKMSC